MRRCVGCGRVAPKPLLVRMALAAREEAGAPVTLDAAGRMSGRGAYLCRADTHNAPRGNSASEGASRPSGDPAGEGASRPSGECFERALRRRAFARAFRQPVNVPAKLIESVGR